MTIFTISGSTSGDGEILSGPFSIDAQIQTHLVDGYYYIDQISGTVDGNTIGGVALPDAGFITTTSGMPLVSGLIFSTTNGTEYILTGGLGGLFNETGSNHSNSNVPLTINESACFVSGTAILTARGEISVEKLEVGDLVVTASGRERPIKWLGHRTVDCRSHPRPEQVMPVCIAAHALSAERPARDLRVSPGHAICVDVAGEVLIPAVSLLNGTTVVQEDVDTVTYWHVELDSHDILLADNMPAESYLEMGNRSFFAEAKAVALHTRPDASVATHADFCRPFVNDGQLLEAVREVLRKRAIRLNAKPRNTRVAA